MRPRLPLAHAEESTPCVAAEALASGSPSQLQVGDLARKSGKTVRALHLYEELGLLRPLGRSKGRYRLYGEDALVRIRWISKLQDLGLSLHEIRAMAQEVENVAIAPEAAERMRMVYAQKLEDTREQLQKLKELEAELEHALGYLGACSSLCETNQSLHQCRSCALHHDSASEVDLVRGFQVVPAGGRAPQAPVANKTKTLRHVAVSK